MGLLIDSSLFIAAERKKFPLPEFLRSEAATRAVYISSITASELLHGIERADTAKRRTRREAFVEAILADYPVLGFGLPEARDHARIWARLRARGEIIGPHDLLIAATALAHGHSVTTLNLDEFSRVEGLAVLDASPWLR